MKVSVDDGDRGQLFDANGLEIHKAISADIDTGEVLQFETNPEGRVSVPVTRIMRAYPKPLTFIRREEKL